MSDELLLIDNFRWTIYILLFQIVDTALDVWNEGELLSVLRTYPATSVTVDITWSGKEDVLYARRLFLVNTVQRVNILFEEVQNMLVSKPTPLVSAISEQFVEARRSFANQWRNVLKATWWLEKERVPNVFTTEDLPHVSIKLFTMVEICMCIHINV